MPLLSLPVLLELVKFILMPLESELHTDRHRPWFSSILCLALND